MYAYIFKDLLLERFKQALKRFSLSAVPIKPDKFLIVNFQLEQSLRLSKK